MSLSLQLGLEDLGALLSGPSYLTADSLCPLLEESEEKSLSEGSASPLSFASYADCSASPLSSLTPPSSPVSFLNCKSEANLLTHPWVSADELFKDSFGGQEDAFSGMDWMVEKMDLNEFDLDSLIGSCDSDDSPSSPEDLLSSLESHPVLDPQEFPISVPEESSCLPEPELSPVSTNDTQIKSEPPSPVPSPSPPPPFSPTFTLELGSEVDVSEAEKIAPVDTAQVPRIVLSIPASRILVLVAPKEEVTTVPATMLVSCIDQSDNDSGVESTSESIQRHASVPHKSSRPGRAKPYCTPTASLPSKAVSGNVKSVSGAPKVTEKKLKKMEQNKSAATRYRQKKRTEQEMLSTECDDLEKRNVELQEKAESITKEIQYLKDLLEEVRLARSRRLNGAQSEP